MANFQRSGIAKDNAVISRFNSKTSDFSFRIVFSSSVTLFLPIMIETERMGIEEAQKQQQRQILLGPGAAVSAGANAPLPPMPA